MVGRSKPDQGIISEDVFSSANTTSETPEIQGLVTAKPWINPANRKLRHIEGVSVRNITFGKSRRYSRVETIDDNAVLTTLSTPEKLRTAHEHDVGLKSSKSSNDLGSNIDKDDAGSLAMSGQLNGAGSARPSFATLRRRSTKNWGNVSPEVRQKKLEDVAGNKLAESFFTIEITGFEHPLYISETINKTINPDFKFFSLSEWGPCVTRSNGMVVNLWAKAENIESYRHTVQMHVYLPRLKWFCKTLGDPIQAPLTSNCMLFHLTDGIYTYSPDDVPSKPQFDQRPSFSDPANTSMLPKSIVSHKQSTATFDTIMNLKNLDTCVQDAINTLNEVTDSINKLLAKNKLSLELFTQASTAKEELTSTKAAVNVTKRSIFTSVRRKAEIIHSNKSRRDAMKAGSNSETAVIERHKVEVSERNTRNEQRAKLLEERRGHVRRIAQNLTEIYSIEPYQDKPLAFTICGHHLPNADDLYKPTLTTAIEQATAAALGFATSVVTALASILDFDLPYPIKPRGSQSTIEDPITNNIPKRILPLYQTGVARDDFEKGVFLLNADLTALMNAEALRVVSPKTTLANLKYLLEVLVSGKGEIPSRKVGGIKALQTGIQRINVTGEIVSGFSEGPIPDSYMNGSIEGQISMAVEKGKEREFLGR